MIINQANYQQQNTFTSRNAIIRRADDIARKINTAYPRISSTNVGDFKYAEQFDGLQTRLSKKIKNLRDLLEHNCKKENSDILSKIIKFAKYISITKLGNCIESAILTYIAVIVNDIENGMIAQVVSEEKGSLDHAVLYILDKKNPYIIDAWLGFADFESNALQRYKNEFNYHFELSKDQDEKIKFAAFYTIFDYFLSNIPKEELKKNFTELKLPDVPKKFESMPPKLSYSAPNTGGCFESVFDVLCEKVYTWVKEKTKTTNN